MPLPPKSRASDGFQIAKSNRFASLVFLCTIAVTLGLLLLLPFTQLLSGDPRDRLMIRSVDVSLPPPPPPPEPPPPPPEEDQTPDVDDIVRQPPPITLSQLEAALNPGMGGAGAFGVDLDAFGMAPEVGQEMTIFEIRDLDRRPRRLRAIPPNFPAEMQVSGLRGSVRVRILIDERGSVSIMEIVSATHREAVQPVRQALVQWQFEPPMRQGQPVRAQYIQPIDYDFSR